MGHRLWEQELTDQPIIRKLIIIKVPPTLFRMIFNNFEKIVQETWVNSVGLKRKVTLLVRRDNLPEIGIGILANLREEDIKNPLHEGDTGDQAHPRVRAPVRVRVVQIVLALVIVAPIAFPVPAIPALILTMEDMAEEGVGEAGTGEAIDDVELSLGHFPSSTGLNQNCFGISKPRMTTKSNRRNYRAERSV